MSRFIFLISFFLLDLPLVFAQDNYYASLSTLEFARITQKDGLSHNNIECIFKDSDGFVWFGTRNGLCRFDGYEINIFRSSDDPNTLSGDRILTINEDKEGYLWIGTYANGLNRYNKRTGSFSGYNRIADLNDRINRIKVFDDGTVWICSNKGLAKYVAESDSFIIYRHSPDNPNSLNSDYVHDIHQTGRGKYYVAAESRDIQLFDPDSEKFTAVQYARDPELKDNYRKRIVEDHHGVLWIAANIHGLASYDPETGESQIFVQKKGQLSSKILTGDMAVDYTGNIWICTDGGGINVLDPSTYRFEYIRRQEYRENSLSTDHIYTLFFDEQNSLWVGTFAEGVNYHSPARYKFRSAPGSQPDLSMLRGKSVISIFQDSKERLWVGTDGNGLFRFDPDGKTRIYVHQEGVQNSMTTNVITSISEDRKGRILVGTYSGGLLSLDPESNRIYRFNTPESESQSPSSGSIWYILPDSKDRIWLGLLGTAVDLYDQENGSFVNFGPSSARTEKIDFENVMCILEDSDGDIWFGTEGDGVYIFDSETSHLIRIGADQKEKITTQGIIKCLYQDRWGKIWIGSEGQGLYRLDKKTLRIDRFSAEDGLTNNIIQSIMEDGQGNIWMGTSNGLSMYNPQTESFRNFIVQDGLSGNEFNQNALVRLHDGRLVIGSSKGIDIFRPEKIQINQNLPRVVFTGFEVLNREIAPGQNIHGRVILEQTITYTKKIVLTHREKVFSIEFAALNYTLPEKCSYLYKLEGFDTEWSEASSNHRRVSYSNLDAGEYIFKVKASNNDGKWGNNDISISISVLPPFYKTWWFKTLLFILLGLVVFFIYQYLLNIHRNRFLSLQAGQQKKIMELEKEKLESELQKMTFHIINRNRVLIDQKNRLLGLSFKARESVKIGLQDIIGIIDEDLNDEKDWTYIEPQLDKVYNNFVSRLKERHPDLTISEIKIAAYVRMNLSTKEISEFMHKTSRAVENDRYRLRKKIGLESNDSLQHYLMNL